MPDVSKNQISDVELVAKCIHGCSVSSRTLYNRYKNLWYTICLRYLRSEQDAQDVLQNALVKIFTKLNTFNGELGNFSSWSSKVVVNEALQLIRKEKSKSFDLERYFVSNKSMTSAVAISNLRLEDIKNLIKDLPKRTRLVFNLYVLEGFNHREIGEMLEISEGSSKSQLSYARKLLQLRLETEPKVNLELITRPA